MAGKHLIIDSIGSRSVSRLTSVDFIYQFLADVPKMTDMDVLIPPHVVRCDVPGNEGVTGVVVITTSHSSIHTWYPGEPHNGKISFDLYSCNDFDHQTITDEFIRRFEPEEIIKCEVVLR